MVAQQINASFLEGKPSWQYHPIISYTFKKKLVSNWLDLSQNSSRQITHMFHIFFKSRWLISLMPQRGVSHLPVQVPTVNVFQSVAIFLIPELD